MNEISCLNLLPDNLGSGKNYYTTEVKKETYQQNVEVLKKPSAESTHPALYKMGRCRIQSP